MFWINLINGAVDFYLYSQRGLWNKEINYPSSSRSLYSFIHATFCLVKFQKLNCKTTLSCLRANSSSASILGNANHWQKMLVFLATLIYVLMLKLSTSETSIKGSKLEISLSSSSVFLLAEKSVCPSCADSDKNNLTRSRPNRRKRIKLNIIKQFILFTYF